MSIRPVFLRGRGEGWIGKFLGLAGFLGFFFLLISETSHASHKIWLSVRGAQFRKGVHERLGTVWIDPQDRAWGDVLMDQSHQPELMEYENALLRCRSIREAELPKPVDFESLAEATREGNYLLPFLDPEAEFPHLSTGSVSCFGFCKPVGFGYWAVTDHHDLEYGESSDGYQNLAISKTWYFDGATGKFHAEKRSRFKYARCLVRDAMREGVLASIEEAQ